MNLIEDWKAVAAKAWSFKFSIAAAIFGGLEMAVQFVQPSFIPNGAFAIMATILSSVAAISRLLSQSEIKTIVEK